MTIENSEIGSLQDKNAEQSASGQGFSLALGELKPSNATHLLTHSHISRVRLQRDRRVQYACNQ